MDRSFICKWNGYTSLRLRDTLQCDSKKQIMKAVCRDNQLQTTVMCNGSRPLHAKNRLSPRVLPRRESTRERYARCRRASMREKVPKDERRKHTKHLSLLRLEKRFFSQVGKSVASIWLKMLPENHHGSIPNYKWNLGQFHFRCKFQSTSLKES